MAMTFFTVAVSRRAAALVPRRPKHRSKVNPQDHVLTPAAPTTAAVNASATAIRKQISIIPWFSGIRSGIMPAPSRRLPAGFKLNSNGITCLVVIVGSAFVVEQLSYLADAARYFMSTDIELLDDNSSRWKVDQQFSKALYYSITDCLVNVSQVVAHSIHFYCFLTFSRTFRNTFYRRMSKIKHSVVFFTRLLKNLLWP
ncbi:unnamed protein product [Soboliphyme baturini]|uniref:CASP-like protein n=1 Tax=Soboliphyme baturini TaxID=241478 RepID=A0A183IJS7_9BILA|nr:unnamed protein product [Soboliphyme baturini]